MNPFAGFPAGKARLTPVPDHFFAELLPAIDDLAELKVTLFMFWYLYRQSGTPRYMALTELEGEGVLLGALSSEEARSASDAIEALRQAISRAVARGTLLQIVISDSQGEETYLFLNTSHGREAVSQVKSGELFLERTGHVREAHFERPRPNIFQLYEDNIGLLQPLIVSELTEATDTYPEAWIDDAFRIAAENNARSWRYVRSILERWSREGRDSSGGSKRYRGRI